MKILFKKLLLFASSLILIFNLSSCSCIASSHSYYFDTQNTLSTLSSKDFKRQDYFTSEVLEFARLENVVILPITQVTSHKYEGKEKICILSIYVQAHSQTGTERVIIKNVTVKEGNSEIVNYAVDSEINIRGRYPKYYSGLLETGTFTEVEFGLKDMNEFTYIIDLELIKDDETISKSMTYEVTSYSYVD